MRISVPSVFLSGAVLASLSLGHHRNALAAAEGLSAFNYDPNSPKGPEFWKDLTDVENNQCGGTSNSPIALETTACTLFEDYQFEVNTGKESEGWLRGCTRIVFCLISPIPLAFLFHPTYP
jgi:hypothetical protein